jgi:redox-sensing transcriptional repressor
MGQKAGSIPTPVVRRLAKYLMHIQGLRKAGVEWVSSQTLAEALGLTSSTVRQDLSHLDISGISKRGYETATLEDVLQRELGGDVVWKAVIVGAGNLGCALATHVPFAKQGFDICGIFDANTRVVGKKVGRLTVQGMEDLPALVRKEAVDIGILAVPVEAAQQVAEQLVEAGVAGLLNLACAHIQVPEGVSVVDAHILENLQELSYLLHASRKKK